MHTMHSRRGRRIIASPNSPSYRLVYCRSSHLMQATNQCHIQPGSVLGDFFPEDFQWSALKCWQTLLPLPQYS